MELTDIITVYGEIINKQEVSFKDLKAKKIAKIVVKKMLNLHMIDISSNSRVINPVYVMGDLNLLYETSLKTDDYKIREIINRYLFLNGFITLPLCLELLGMTIRKRDYDFLFEVLFKVKELYGENEELNKEIRDLLDELSFITRLPPILNEQIMNYKKKENTTSILLSDIKGYVHSAKRLLFSKRDKEISRYLDNNDYLALKNFLENEESKFSNLRKNDMLILHVVREIINLLKMKKLEIRNGSFASLDELIYSNNFKKALKVIKRKKQRKSFIIDDNLAKILEKANYILDNIDVIKAESKNELCQVNGKSYCKLM